MTAIDPITLPSEADRGCPMCRGKGSFKIRQMPGGNLIEVQCSCITTGLPVQIIDGRPCQIGEWPYDFGEDGHKPGTKLYT